MDSGSDTEHEKQRKPAVKIQDDRPVEEVVTVASVANENNETPRIEIVEDNHEGVSHLYLLDMWLWGGNTEMFQISSYSYIFK